MPNQEAILDNVRKLMKMGLAGNELLAQLEEIGIPRIQAERFVREAENPTNQSGERQSKSYSSNTENAPTFAQAAARTETVPAKPITQASSQAYQNPMSGTNVEKLWEKGILATVDTRLAQMQAIKKDVDNVIEKKVDEHYQVVEKKLEAMFESQRELFKFRTDAQLESKAKDIDDILSQKIDEIRQLNVATKEDVQRLKGQKMMVGEILQDINTKVATLDETKRIIATDVAQKLETVEDKVERLIDQTDERVRDVENRATRVLELQEKITSGLTEQVQTQANHVLEERVKDLREELKSEIIQLKKLGADLASKDIQQTLNEFKTLNEQMTKTKAEMDGLAERKAREMDAMLEKKLLNVDKIVNTKMETVVNAKEKDFFEKVDRQSAEMLQNKRELANKIIEADSVMQNVGMFQKQFVEMSKKNNMERMEQLSEFKKQVDAFNARADEKIQLMETRLRQLDLVVNQLSTLMSKWGEQGMVGRNMTENTKPPSTGNESTQLSDAPDKNEKKDSSPPEKEMQAKMAEKKEKKGFGLFKKK